MEYCIFCLHTMYKNKRNIYFKLIFNGFSTWLHICFCFTSNSTILLSICNRYLLNISMYKDVPYTTHNKQVYVIIWKILLLIIFIVLPKIYLLYFRNLEMVNVGMRYIRTLQDKLANLGYLDIKLTELIR